MEICEFVLWAFLMKKILNSTVEDVLLPMPMKGEQISYNSKNSNLLPNIDNYYDFNIATKFFNPLQIFNATI